METTATTPLARGSPRAVWHRLAYAGVLASWAVLTTGCAGMRAPTVPMPSVEYAGALQGCTSAMVFLPGRGGSPANFTDASFPALAREHGVRATLVGADAHLGYYHARNVAERLAADVVAPLRAHGVERVVLVGVSMGGLGAIIYAEAHPDEVAQIVLLAPYLGERDVIDDIAAVGGLARWQPGAVAAGDSQRDLWRWLKAAVRPGSGAPELLLGWGLDDSLAAADSLLAATLPADHVFSAAGSHNWKTWSKLWLAMLESGRLADGCS